MTTNATFPDDPFPLYRQADNKRKELKKKMINGRIQLITAFKPEEKVLWGTRTRTYVTAGRVGHADHPAVQPNTFIGVPIDRIAIYLVPRGAELPGLFLC